jgi:hypothetical protein
LEWQRRQKAQTTLSQRRVVQMQMQIGIQQLDEELVGKAVRICALSHRDADAKK